MSSYGPGPQCPHCQSHTEVVGGFNAADYIKCSACGFYGDHWQDEDGTQIAPPPGYFAPAGADANRAADRLMNIGRIVLALSSHEPRDFGDSGLNDPILNIIDTYQPAHKLVERLASMSIETAAGLVRQGCPPLSSLYEQCGHDELPF
jgi:hypothetical protein